jgi:hypothetical protein
MYGDRIHIAYLFFHDSFNEAVSKRKVKFTLEQAMKAQKGSRAITQLFL